MTKFKKGDHIIYVPTHAEGDISHPDCERGFVTHDERDEQVFCKFFYPNGELRTKANSERCYKRDLVLAHRE